VSIGEADPVADRAPSRAPDVGDATPPKVEPYEGAEMAPGFERIVKSIYEVDVYATYESIRDLRLPVRVEHASRETMREALERAEECARDAHLLFCNAKVALEAFLAESESVMGVLRGNARARLAEEARAAKDEGVKAKQVTNADVDAEVARSHSDAVRRIRVREQERKRMVDHLELLASIWRDRRRTLEALLNSARV